MIYKMPNLKIKAPRPFKKKQKSIELSYSYKDEYWGFGKIREYIEYLFEKVVNMSH